MPEIRSLGFDIEHFKKNLIQLSTEYMMVA